MVLGHGIKHCLPWVTDQQDVRGYKTCRIILEDCTRIERNHTCLAPSSALPPESCHYPNNLRGIRLLSPENSLGVSYHASSANSWGNWDRNATESKIIQQHTKEKGWQIASILSAAEYFFVYSDWTSYERRWEYWELTQSGSCGALVFH